MSTSSPNADPHVADQREGSSSPTTRTRLAGVLRLLIPVLKQARL